MYQQYSKVIPFTDLPDPGDHWELVDKIGEGTYGEVHTAKRKDTGEVVAVKIMESIHEVVEEIEEEYLVLRDLSKHPNLPAFHGLFLKQDPQEADQLWIAMELCAGGSVTDLVKALLERDQKLEELLIAHIMKETIKALSHLHKNHVMHRDIKGHNILLTPDGDIKLIDFGVSGHLKKTLDRRSTSVGTPFWMAPEVIACEQQLDYDYDNRCDVWSLGVTAIELAEGEPPLADLHPMRALFKIPRNPPPTLQVAKDWTEKFQDFIAKCVIKDFERRPYLDKMLQHPFIAQVPEDTTQIKDRLRQMISDTSSVIHEPYTTTKHGKLRSRRKPNPEPISAVDDLATLEKLDEEVIVSQLKQRYDKGVIYTYIGDILLAVNPFTPLTIYSDEYSRLYRNASKPDNAPHIFAVADQSYQAMMHHHHNQCIVISGESGSGKTESANFLVQQLTLLGRAPNRSLEDRILQVNPLVEAFGNAKTVINDNSSRFGKYLEMTFTSNGKVTGAKLSEYLLEKSRVIHQARSEKNFHIFYYAHDGLAHEDRLGKYHLKDHQGYRYLNGYNRDQPDISAQSIHRVKFKTVQRCFEMIGFKAQEVTSVYSILAAILHIGNIDFTEKEIKHQTGSKVDNTDNTLDIVADLLGIDGKELQEALTTSGMVARGETIIRHNTIAEAVNVRDAMSKAMYGRLFSWIVNKINMLLKPAKSREDDGFAVGILDIFGFENFEHNSFEQLCINIANEQIQYYFNQHIFAWEQQEYKNEGIEAEDVSYVDNRAVLDMFLVKPIGLLALLDEESNFPKATDFTLVEKFNHNIQCAFFSKPKSQALVFSVEHYAGKVNYDAEGFLEKNRDRLAGELINVLRMSQIALMRTLFNSPITKTGNLAYNSLSSSLTSLVSSPTSSVGSAVSIRSASNPGSASASQSRTQQTVATYFRYSLMDLLSKMVAGTPHFVRCVRPNVENSPGFYDEEKVEIQLRYTGVLETTRIRRQGYSHRIPFSEFLKRYYILGFNFNEKVRVNKDNCKLLLERVGLENWALGKTKVFLKYYHIEQLSRRFEEQQRRVVMAQAVIRMWIQKKRFRKRKIEMIEGAIKIQRIIRGWLIRRKYRYLLKDRSKAATAIQTVVRGFLARRRYRPVLQRRHSAVLTLQAYLRGYAQRRKYRNYKALAVNSAVRIQAVFRGFKARQRAEKERMSQDASCRRAAVILQKYFRMWKAQSVLVRLQLQQTENDQERTEFTGQIETAGEQAFQNMEQTNVVASEATRQTAANGGLSQERRDQMTRLHETKALWTSQETEYYDSLSESNKKQGGVWQRKKGQMKRLGSASLLYYDKIAAESRTSPQIRGHRVLRSLNGSTESQRDPQQERSVALLIKELERSFQPHHRVKAITDSSVNDKKDPVSEANSQHEAASENHSDTTEVADMFRDALAASAASKFLANKPPTGQAAAATETSAAAPASNKLLQKSESQYSLAWDTILEQAKEKELAPDSVPNSPTDIASDVGTGIPSIDFDFGDEDDLDISDQKDENTTEIQLINNIEEDEMVYREELIAEQEEMRQELIRKLELQRQSCLATRFARRQKSEQDQEETEQRWRQIQTLPDGQETEVYKKILTRGSSKEKIKPPQPPFPTQKVTLNKTKVVEEKTTTSADSEPGVFNFRALLRKTNIDPESPKTRSVEVQEGGKVDFRSVLKKNAIDNEEVRLKRHIYAS